MSRLAAHPRAGRPSEASVTRSPYPESSCQSQFIAYQVLSFASRPISERTHGESDPAPDGLPQESPVERGQGLPKVG